jgi:hypothetical protein
MNDLPKMSPNDPLVGRTQWTWPYGPFVLADEDGNPLDALSQRPVPQRGGLGASESDQRAAF